MDPQRKSPEVRQKKETFKERIYDEFILKGINVITVMQVKTYIEHLCFSV